MPQLAVNDLMLEVQQYGSSKNPALVMIMGLSNQLIDWPASLVQRLAADYHVILFDNRDAGLSSQCATSQSYSLEAMAQDTLALADMLGLERFHVVGFSMGGLIAQILALAAPEHVLSLVSLMSADGVQNFASKPEAEVAMQALMVNIPDSSERIRHWYENAKVYRGSGVCSSDEELHTGITQALTRSFCPQGTARQWRAIRSTPDRDISQITCPTLILHGDEDPCILVQHAYRTQQKIAHATLQLLSGVGHELPEAVVPVIYQAMTTHWRHAVSHSA